MREGSVLLVVCFCIAFTIARAQDPWVTSCSDEVLTRTLYPLKTTDVRFATFTGAIPTTTLDFHAVNFMESSLQAAEVPFGHFSTGTPPCTEYHPIKTLWPVDSDVVVRFHVNVNFPLVLGTAVINVLVDGALMGVWLNGHPLHLTSMPRECGGGPLAIPIPADLLILGDNVVAIHASNQAPDSYLWFDVQARICYDYCELQSKTCLFYFEGYGVHDAPVFNLSTPNNPDFTTTILSRKGGRITNLESDFVTLFMDADTSVVQPLSVLGMSPTQFKTFNDPLPKIVFEPFLGETEDETEGLCVVMRFSSWQQSGTTIHLNSVDDCPNCCIILRTPGDEH